MDFSEFSFLDNLRKEFNIIDLRGANLAGANLFGAILRGANLIEAHLLRASLTGVSLTGAVLVRANLVRANLTGADLTGADLEGADLVNANLVRANLEGANLEEADLVGADLERANLRGVNLTGTILDNRVSQAALDDISKLSKLQQRAEQLQKEKEYKDMLLAKKEKELEALASSEQAISAQLASEIADLKEENEKKDREVEKIKKEAENKIEEIEQRGKEIEGSLSDAFTALEGVNNDVKPEILRLKWMFWISAVFIVVFLTTLCVIWWYAFSDLRPQTEEIKMSRIWLYTSPSLILVGFIGVCVAQINRAQRQLVTLRKYTRKYKVIKVALEGYYKVEDKLKKTPEKAQETFSAIIKQGIAENMDTEKEENALIKDSEKDKTPVNDILSTLIEALQKVKDEKRL